MPLLKKDLLEFVLSNKPANFFFIIYDLLTMPEKCQVAGNIESESSFTFKFLKHYIFYGPHCFDYFKAIPRESELVTISFEKENLSNVQEHFQGFECSDKSGEGSFNHFMNMSCSKSQFNGDVKAKTKGVRALTLKDWGYTWILFDARTFGWY